MICPITNDWCRTNGCGENCYKRDSLGYSTAPQHDVKLTVSRWVAVEDELPNNLETVWISNGKGWTTLGCLVGHIDGWHWAATNGVIYQDNGLIVSECESDDLDVRFWHELPKPPFC